MKKVVKTEVFGYPKIGVNRELKKVLESFWSGKISRDDFLRETEEIKFARLKRQKKFNIDFISSNDFSLYDFILDLSTMFGIIPERFCRLSDKLDTYFAMARGNDDATACEMTKWFDTNYHYIVPEIAGKFELKENRPLKAYLSAKEKFGINTTPTIIGPFTFLKLAKGYKKEKFASHLLEAASLYGKVLKELENNGVKRVRIEEPAFVLDLTDKEAEILIKAYSLITKDLNIVVYVQTYYESLSQYNKIVNELPVCGIGMDFVVNSENIENIRKFGFPKNKQLIAGVVSGRDIWKTDFIKTASLITELFELTGQEEIIISNSSPLYHLPVSLEPEKNYLNADLIQLLSFADERLDELTVLKQIINEKRHIPKQNFEEIKEIFKNEKVREAVTAVKEDSIGRKESFEQRYALQKETLKLPLSPTTTIGSYPQTAEIRKFRTAFKESSISEEEYDDFIKNEIKKVVELQEEIGLDVLVHGEFERNDMVEYFGQKLKGFAFTKNAWVQSYGSRCVKPPIIYGDVYRPQKMTVDAITYAQSLTQKTVKGMLTGPVTILNWSFFRKDISKKEIAFQIALALKDEVMDLEKAGIKIIQIDEAAFREGMPLKKGKQKNYLDWAVKSFKLTNEKVSAETQIHTHMCYSEFNEILESVYDMDSDVISIEASRSKGEIIEKFEEIHYDHGIGLGVYDIHSPRIPTEKEIILIVERSIKVIDKELFWINPDCGLKTRSYNETIPALKNMVNVAKKFRGSNN